MNLQQAYNSPGNWIVMRGIPTEYNMKTGQYGPYALGKFCDDNQQIVDMMFSGGKDTPLPQMSLLHTQCIWAVKYDANTQKLKALFKSYANEVSRPLQSVQQMPQQAPQTPPQRPNVPPAGRDATGVSIERQACVKALCELASRRNDLIPDEATFFDWLGHAHKWVETGTVNFTVSHSPMPTGPADWQSEELPPELQEEAIPF